MKIRPTKHYDIANLQIVLDKTGLFPGEMLPDMAAGFLGGNEGEDIWLSCEVDGAAVGFCYAVPEALTEGTWNMLAIAVHPDKQGQGCGQSLSRQLETVLKERGNRILIADTSGTDGFANTRAFYAGNGYVEEARIRGFWSEGDDKVIFLKML